MRESWNDSCVTRYHPFERSLEVTTGITWKSRGVRTQSPMCALNLRADAGVLIGEKLAQRHKRKFVGATNSARGSLRRETSPMSNEGTSASRPTDKALESPVPNQRERRTVHTLIRWNRLAYSGMRLCGRSSL